MPPPILTHLASLITAWRATMELIPARGRAQVDATFNALRARAPKLVALLALGAFSFSFSSTGGFEAVELVAPRTQALTALASGLALASL